MARLLIVDDNAAFADNLAEILGDFGNDVAVADSGERALELARGDRFDVLISDMRMPKMGGLELIRALRRIDGGLPAVVVTAYSADHEEAAMHAGIMEVLPKPVPISKLLQIVGRARRNGVVAIIVDDQALVDKLSELIRDHGFAPVVALGLGELQSLASQPLFAGVVSHRLSGAAEAMRTFTSQFPTLPMLIVNDGPDPVPSNATIPKPLDSGSLLEMLEHLHAASSARVTDLTSH